MNGKQSKAAVRVELSSRTFEGLLARLGPDREQAGENYENLRRKLVKFFDWSACAAAEECADDTLDRVARKLATPPPIEDVVAFIWGVARNLRREARKKIIRTIQIEGSDADEHRGSSALRGQSGPDLKVEELERVALLQRCMERLPEADRKLFLEYHETDAGDRESRRQALAAALGITIGGLRVRINRIRERLEQCVTRDRLPPKKG